MLSAITDALFVTRITVVKRSGREVLEIWKSGGVEVVLFALDSRMRIVLSHPSGKQRRMDGAPQTEVQM